MELIRASWQHFSDHLPVGVRFTTGLSVVSCNILNKNYVYHITDEPNAQFLGGSVITQSHSIPIQDDTLDEREVCAFSWICDLLMRKLKISVICLQEVSAYLCERLTESGEMLNYTCVPTVSSTWKNREIVLFDRSAVAVFRPPSLWRYCGDSANRMCVLECVYLRKCEGQQQQVEVTEQFPFWLLSTHCRWGYHEKLDAQVQNLLERSYYDEREEYGVPKKPTPVLVCGDFNVDSRVFVREFPRIHDAMQFTSHYFTHIRAGGVTPVQKKLAKYDYMLVSKKRRGVNEESEDEEDWWASQFLSIDPQELRVENDVDLLEKIYRELET